MVFSYITSNLLYYGFKVTKGKTYDSVMKEILGVKLGFLSNFMIWIHTFAAVVSVWLFSYQFLLLSLIHAFYGNNLSFKEIEKIDKQFFKYYCVFIFLLLFINSLIRKVEFLKKLSIIGVLILLYLIILFLALLPEYNREYKKRIIVVYAVFDKNIFITSGICFYLFLNQYTVIPICNNLKRVKSKRLAKVVILTDTLCLLIYISFTFIGYFSMPNDVIGTDEEIKWELFLIRPSIDG